MARAPDSGRRAPDSTRLDLLTTVDVRAAACRTLLVPLGATEQHGPHLPIGTDTFIATAWAEAVAALLSDVLVAPTLPYGSSGEHQAFAGTLSIGHEALLLVLIELVRSAANDFDRIVFVSGHAGNGATLHSAVSQLRHEGHDVHFVLPRIPGADAHAGHTETSLMMHLVPAAVKTEVAVAGSTTPLAEVIDRLRTDGVAAVSPNGVLGDPTKARAASGVEVFEHLVNSLAASLA